MIFNTLIQPHIYVPLSSHIPTQNGKVCFLYNLVTLFFLLKTVIHEVKLISSIRYIQKKPNSANNRSQLSAHNQITYKTVRIEQHFRSPAFNIQKIEFRAHEIWIVQHVNELVGIEAQGLKTTLPLKLFRNTKRESMKIGGIVELMC